MLGAIIPFVTFALRHFLATTFCIAAGCLLWTVAYIVLLLVAIVGGYGIGGLFAYPGGIIALVFACVGIGGGIFAPSSGFGVIFCSVFRLPKLAAIPVVFVTAFLISHFFCWACFRFATTLSVPSTWVILKTFSLFLSVPLGMYWWLTEGPGAIIDAIRRRLPIRSLKSKSNRFAPSELSISNH